MPTSPDPDRPKVQPSATLWARTETDPGSGDAPSARNDAGFTLLEALVGLVLVALVITTVLQAARTGVLAADKTDRAATLATAVRGVLDRLGADIPLDDGPRAGSFADGTTWRVEPVEFGTVAGVAALYAIRVEVGGTPGTTVVETHRAIRLAVDGGVR